MRWEQGRATIEQMLADGELQRVPASRQQAERLLAQARHHLHSATKVQAEDPAGGYALAYDAARKALAAVLENQGLRPTSRGGHLAIAEAVRAQLDPPMGAILRRFNRMRVRRNQAEYPPGDTPVRAFARAGSQVAPPGTSIQRMARGHGSRPLSVIAPRRASPDETDSSVVRSASLCAAAN